MKNILWSFLMINILVFLSSCASLDQKDSNEMLMKAVKAKIESRNYVIDIPKSGLSVYKQEGILPDEGTENLQEPGFIHVSGDTLYSCMDYDFGVRSEFDYGHRLPFFSGETFPSFKYKIVNYKLQAGGRGVTQVKFMIRLSDLWFNCFVPLFAPVLHNTWAMVALLQTLIKF